MKTDRERGLHRLLPVLLVPAMALLLGAGPRPETARSARWQPFRPPAGERAHFDPAAELRREHRAEVEALTAQLKRALPRPRADADGVLRLRAEGDTVKVMVCLLGFAENRRPDLTTVPADGRFMAAADTLPEWLLAVDPPPHDAAYFEAHLRAMREFYRIQSYGKLDIEWDILDGPDDGLFLMSDIADYGPGESGGYWTLELLESFCREAVDSIDTALQSDPDGPRFADYDHVMIFHAGSDFQNDIFQDSPNDLPSFNIFFGEWPVVDGGDHELGSVLLLPETTTQDADPAAPIYGALNAVTAHEFGHQLGLVDTYNTIYGWPAVGYWDIMDSGHQILYGFQTAADPDNPIFVYGALPTSFGIWHRMLLGWVEEADGSMLRPGGGEHDIALQASNLQVAGPKALRVDLSEREYFLLESRQELLQARGRYVKRDADTGVFQFVSIDYPQFPDSAENSGEYDLFLPQSGLLAWHIDERDFETLYPLNEINPDGDRHVRLVEADGADDLGNPYSAQWRGNDLDPFYTGNNTEWLELTVPDTRLRDGTPSGFVMDELVTSPYLDDEFAVDSTISFHIARGGVPAGFPRDDRARVENTLALQPVAGSLLPLPGEGWLGYVMESLDADTLLQSHIVAGGTEAGGEPPLTPLPPELLSAPLVGSALVDDPSLGPPFWVLLLADARVLGWGPPAPGETPSLRFDIGLGAQPDTRPIVLSSGAGVDIFWLTADRALDGLSISRERGAEPVARHFGRTRDEAAAPAALTGLDAGPFGSRLGVGVGDSLYVVRPDDGETLATYSLPDPGEGPFWLLSFREDELLPPSGRDIYWVHVDGRVALPGRNGEEPELLFTVPLDGGRLQAEPAVADLDGDGRLELLLAGAGRVHRVSLDGHSHDNWPLRLDELADIDEPMSVGSGLRAADMTGDGVSELILFGDSGHLLVVGASGQPLLGTPRSLAAAPPRDVYAPGGVVYAVSRDGFLLAFVGAGGAGTVPDWSCGGGDPQRQFRGRALHALAPLDGFPGEDWKFYPNPAGVSTRLQHPAVPAGTTLRLECFDLEGQLKFTREETVANAGPYEVELELRGLASGVYFFRLELESGGTRRHLLKRLAVMR